MRTRSLRTTLALVAALTLGACAAPAAEDDGNGGGVPERLQFSAMTLDGEDFDGASLYGQPTIVWFWASWCPICQADAPLIADALDELPDGVQAIGIPGRSDDAGMREFVAKYHLEDMVQVVDADGSLWSNFQVASQPAVVLIDAEGNIKTIPGSMGKATFLQNAASIA